MLARFNAWVRRRMYERERAGDLEYLWPALKRHARSLEEARVGFSLARGFKPALARAEPRGT